MWLSIYVPKIRLVPYVIFLRMLSYLSKIILNTTIVSAATTPPGSIFQTLIILCINKVALHVPVNFARFTLNLSTSEVNMFILGRVLTLSPTYASHSFRYLYQVSNLSHFFLQTISPIRISFKQTSIVPSQKPSHLSRNVAEARQHLILQKSPNQSPSTRHHAHHT